MPKGALCCNCTESLGMFWRALTRGPFCKNCSAWELGVESFKKELRAPPGLTALFLASMMRTAVRLLCAMQRVGAGC